MLRSVFLAVTVLLAINGSNAMGSAGHDHSSHDHSSHDHEGDGAPLAGPMDVHAHDEGFILASSDDESVETGGRCSRDQPVRDYDVVAIAVDITLNRYLDHDPDGRMYVLEEDLASVREEEAANERARAAGGDPAVSLGLQGDAIQPLVLRALPGECLRVHLRNGLPDMEPATFHVHGSQVIVEATGRPAIATEPSAVALPGDVVTYEWAVPAGEPEGAHHVHSHGDSRRQTVHGMFGAVIVEPAGSTWVDQVTGEADTVSWSAIVEPPDEPAFREFVTFYHEVGTESEVPLDASDQPLPLADPITGSYKPSGRALNYRSEPFMHRLQLQMDQGQTPDESIAYSSYAFGDPATPIMRAYVGDPVIQRVVHGGSEVFHVHHVHGGSIRWPRQPGVDDVPTITALEKNPPLLPAGSERTDSQSLGPSESFDVVPECGAGGCQQSVGDVLYHCHVAQHYISGMWGIWRVYNTLQDGKVSTDELPPLPELPDRNGAVSPAVASDELPAELVDRIEGLLPPQGEPTQGDASVWDWLRESDAYLGEPGDPTTWPGHPTPESGRTPLLFDPRDGLPAFPHLRPHLGRRPPFAPGHGPAPYLDLGGRDPEIPRPGENGDRSVCPAGTRVRPLDITAIDAPIPLNAEENLVDPMGMLFVRREERDGLLDDPSQRTPLVLRTNAVADCVDVTLTSEVADRPENHWLSKVNAHIHFVQFDVQGSDGVDAGFNYEQSVRPWPVESETIEKSVGTGNTRLPVANATRFSPGALVMVGVDTADRAEIHTVKTVGDGWIELEEPTGDDHSRGERVTTEFVRYRWYPDVQFGTAFFHDHVNAIFSGEHGLWGALVAEPPDATWHDPDTGAELLSGPVADIHTTGAVSVNVDGSFREVVVFLQDGNRVTRETRSPGSSLGLRVEPLDPRMADDPATAFDSTRHGDPETVVVRARAGDPIVLRTLVSAANEVHTLHVDGHGFRIEPWLDTSPLVATAHLGISERLDLVIPAAGGPARLPGDYLIRNGRIANLREGSWGLIRVLPSADAEAPRPLPGLAASPPGDGVCPADAPLESFDVTAIESRLPMMDGGLGLVFVPTDAVATVESGERAPEPLVLRATVGDCIEVHLDNATTGYVSFEPDLVVFDPSERAVGRNGGRPLAPGESRTMQFHAHPSFGQATVLVLDGADPLNGPRRGAYAAIAVADTGATFHDPATGEEVETGWRVDVVPQGGDPYRDFVLFMQEEDASIGTHLMPYRDEVSERVGISYASEPLSERRLVDPESSSVFRSEVHGDASTPLLEAYAGDPVRLRVLAPVSAQGNVFTLEGHRWRLEPRPGSSLMSSVKLGGLETAVINLEGGAGGPAQLAGDYLYGSHREPHREAGMWGIFRVWDPCEAEGRLRQLTDTVPSCPAVDWGWAARAGALIGVAGLGILLARMRRRPQRADMGLRRRRM